MMELDLQKEKSAKVSGHPWEVKIDFDDETRIPFYFCFVEEFDSIYN
jgi:hypothetical protein